MKVQTGVSAEEVKAFGTSFICKIEKRTESKAKESGIIMPDMELTKSLAKKGDEMIIPDHIKDLNEEIFIEIISSGKSAKENGLYEGMRVVIHPQLLSTGIILPYKNLPYHLVVFEMNAILVIAEPVNQSSLNT